MNYWIFTWIAVGASLVSIGQTAYFNRKFASLRRRYKANADRSEANFAQSELYLANSIKIFRASSELMNHVSKCGQCQRWGVTHCPQGLGLQFDFGEVMRTARETAAGIKEGSQVTDGTNG